MWSLQVLIITALGLILQASVSLAGPINGLSSVRAHFSTNPTHAKKDYLPLDDVAAQLKALNVSAFYKDSKASTGDYLHLEEVASQLGSDVLSSANQIPKGPSKASRIAFLLNLEDIEVQLKPYAPTAQSPKVVRAPETPHQVLMQVASELDESGVCIVKKGAVVSKIARDVCAGPLYEQQGCLAKILSLNHELSNPNLIFPGQKLYIPTGERSSNFCESRTSRSARIPAGATHHSSL